MVTTRAGLLRSWRTAVTPSPTTTGAGASPWRAGAATSVGRVGGTSAATGSTAALGPRIQEAPAATNIATSAKSNAACSPSVKGVAIRLGKKL